MKLCFVVLALSFLLVSCSKNGDYVHFVKPGNEGALYDGWHKVKEMQGDARADILWVIDASGSMGSWHTQVAQNAANFMKGFTQNARIDWKLGLISMDGNDDPFVGFPPQSPALDTQTANPTQVFQTALQNLDSRGGGGESIFDPVVHALSKYPNFVRPNSVLVLIPLTDAPEQSFTYTAQNFFDLLTRMKGDLRRVFTYGIFGPQDWGCPQTDDFWNYAGSPYEQVIKRTVGKAYKLCDPNFSANLINLGQDIGQRVSKPRLPLEKRPVLSTLKVFFHDKELPGGPKEEGGYWIYDYDLNAILFHDLNFAPGDDEQVRVTYREDVGNQ